jgi:hypothetical protein
MHSQEKKGTGTAIHRELGTKELHNSAFRIFDVRFVSILILSADSGFLPPFPWKSDPSKNFLAKNCFSSYYCLYLSGLTAMNAAYFSMNTPFIVARLLIPAKKEVYL